MSDADSGPDAWKNYGGCGIARFIGRQVALVVVAAERIR